MESTQLSGGNADKVSALTISIPRSRRAQRMPDRRPRTKGKAGDVVEPGLRGDRELRARQRAASSSTCCSSAGAGRGARADRPGAAMLTSYRDRPGCAVEVISDPLETLVHIALLSERFPWLKARDLPRWCTGYDMGSAISTGRVSGQTSYHVAESARIGGESRIVSERYLEEAANIEATTLRPGHRSGPTSPSRRSTESSTPRRACLLPVVGDDLGRPAAALARRGTRPPKALGWDGATRAEQITRSSIASSPRCSRRSQSSYRPCARHDEQSSEDNYELVEGSASLDRPEGLRDNKVRLWSRTLPFLLWPLKRGYGKAVLGLPRPLRRPSASSQSSTPVLDGAGSASQGKGRSRGCHHLGPGSVPPGRGGQLLEEQATELCPSFAIDERARGALEEELLGRGSSSATRASGETTVTIVAGHRSEQSVEGDFPR